MVQLPIGFFMPLPLPVMIPFMMWQSAAIAAGFGTYFQFAKRKVSAMSNEEFNRADPHKLVEDLYDDIISAMPSSFTKIDSMTPIILDSMLKMLTNALDWFAGVLGGTGLTDLQRRLAGGGAINPFENATGSPVGEGTETEFVPGIPGQASIPSVAWLNSLSREQLKNIRNDALRGDYNESSKTLILARYKEIFDFDKNAGIGVPSALPVPINVLKPGTLLVFQKATFTAIPQLILTRINNNMAGGDFRSNFLILASLRASAVKRLKNTRQSAAGIRSDERMVRQIDKMIQLLNDHLKISGGLRT